jgi:twitching motility protein PilT
LEVLVSTGLVRELIADRDRTKEISEAIAKGHTTYGMQSFDQSLMQLVKEGLVTYEEALKNVSNPDDFALRYRGIASTSDSNWDDFQGPETDSIEDPAEDDQGPDEKDDDFSIDRF